MPVGVVCDMLDCDANSVTGSCADLKLGGFIYFASCFLLRLALFASKEMLNRLGLTTIVPVIGGVAAISFAATLRPPS